MSNLMNKIENSGKLDLKNSKSSQSSHLYKIKKEARKIREDHAAGKITAEQAAKMLRELLYSPHSNRFDSSRTRISA